MQYPPEKYVSGYRLLHGSGRAKRLEITLLSILARRCNPTYLDYNALNCPENYWCNFGRSAGDM
jgi:hypothetical protein